MHRNLISGSVPQNGQVQIFVHKAGDMRLEEIAGRLKRFVRPNDTVARHGCDEFVVVANYNRGA